MVTERIDLPTPKVARPKIPAIHISAKGSYHSVGDPNGRFPAGIGAIYMDDLTGDTWRKQTDDGFATGWVIDVASATYSAAEVDAIVAAIPTGGTTSGSPEGVIAAIPTSLRWDPVARTLWFKDTGTGATGWIELLTI